MFGFVIILIYVNLTGMKCYLAISAITDCTTTNEFAAPPYKRFYITVLLDSDVASVTCFSQCNILEPMYASPCSFFSLRYLGMAIF